MTAVSSAWKEIPEKEFEIFAPLIIDLNGAASSQVIMPVSTEVIWGGETAAYSYVIKELIVVCTTAFAAGGTSNLLLGKSGTNNTHHTYSTPNGTTAGTVLRIAQASFSGEPRVAVGNKTIEIACIGGLGAAGACRVGVRVSRRYNEWTGYVANRL